MYFLCIRVSADVVSISSSFPIGMPFVSFTVFFFFFKQVVFFSNIFLSLLLFSDNFYMVLDLSMSVCKFSFSSLIINLSKAKILI